MLQLISSPSRGQSYFCQPRISIRLYGALRSHLNEWPLTVIMKGPKAPCSPGSLHGTNIIILRRANKDHQLAIASGQGYRSIERGDVASRNRGDSAPTAETTYNPLRDVREPCALNKTGQSHGRVRIGTRDSLTKIEAKTESRSGLMRVLSMELGFSGSKSPVRSNQHDAVVSLETTSNSNMQEHLRGGELSDRKLCGAE